MLKIGLTGGIASGKSTACSFFEKLGISVIDADTITRQLVEVDQQSYQEIIQCFGDSILLENGELDRKQLRDRIFSDQRAKQQLEQILHPKVRQQLIEQSQDIKTPYCILAIPLLIEAEMTDLVDRVLVIDSEPTLQLQRLQQRDNCSLEQAKNLIAQQCDRQLRLNAADDIISNNFKPADLQKNIAQLHQSYLNLVDTKSSSCQSQQSHGE